MKVLKSLAVLALVFTLGACETKPKDETNPFLDAVKGKTVLDSSNRDLGTFSSDGRILNSTGTGTGGVASKLNYQGADSDLIGKYKDPGGAIWTFTLNADKQGGKADNTQGTIVFTFK